MRSSASGVTRPRQVSGGHTLAIPWAISRVMRERDPSDARHETTTSMRSADCFLLPADILVCRQGHRNGDVISLRAISIYGSRDGLLQKKRGLRSFPNQECRPIF